jgi:hypothetical protein
VVVIAFKGPPLDVDWKDVKFRAIQLEKVYKLPTKAWIPGLRSNNVGQEYRLGI